MIVQRDSYNNNNKYHILTDNIVYKEFVTIQRLINSTKKYMHGQVVGLHISIALVRQDCKDIQCKYL